MWQDYVITVVQAVFVVSLLPTIRDKSQKPALPTALITGMGMVALTVVYGSKGWWYGGAVAAIVATQWFVLGWQRYRIDAKSGRQTIPLRKLIQQLLD